MSLLLSSPNPSLLAIRLSSSIPLFPPPTALPLLPLASSPTNHLPTPRFRLLQIPTLDLKPQNLMDFFSSVFSTDPPNDDENDEHEEEEEGEEEQQEPEPEPEEEETESSIGGGGWSFGGLIKTFASRSESVIQTYRKDLEDLGSGLRLETSTLRAAAVRAAAALPSALDVSASAASSSLESVGQAVDDLGAAAASILSHANQALLQPEDNSDEDQHQSDSTAPRSDSDPPPPPPLRKKYTRFEAQVMALRADPATFTEEPEDAEGFDKWKAGFRMDDERKQEIEEVLRESPGLGRFVEKLVPDVVDYKTFWCRYFFRVDKLRQAEDVRTKLVNRAMSKEQEEELSWEVDDDDDDNDTNNNGNEREEEKKEENKYEKIEQEQAESQETQDNGDEREEDNKEENRDKKVGLEQTEVQDKEKVEEAAALVTAMGANVESNSEECTLKSNGESNGEEGRTEAGDSSKDSDFSMVSRPSAQEEDLSWDEIEDLGDQEEKKDGSPRSSPPCDRADLRQRLSTAVEDEEDLNWDVEEEGETSKP